MLVTAGYRRYESQLVNNHRNADIYFKKKECNFNQLTHTINNGTMNIIGLSGLNIRGKIIKDCTGWDFTMWLLTVLMGWPH